MGTFLPKNLLDLYTKSFDCCLVKFSGHFVKMRISALIAFDFDSLSFPRGNI